MNLIDIVIVSLSIYSFFIGWQRGAFEIFSSLFGLISGTWFILFFNNSIKTVFHNYLKIDSEINHIIILVVLLIVFELFISYILIKLFSLFPLKVIYSRLNKIIGSIFALILCLYIVFLIINFSQLLLINRSINQLINKSYIIRLFDTYNQQFKKQLGISGIKNDNIIFLYSPSYSNLQNISVLYQNWDLIENEANKKQIVDFINFNFNSKNKTAKYIKELDEVIKNQAIQLLKDRAIYHSNINYISDHIYKNNFRLKVSKLYEFITFSTDIDLLKSNLQANQEYNDIMNNSKIFGFSVGFIDAGNDYFLAMIHFYE